MRRELFILLLLFVFVGLTDKISLAQVKEIEDKDDLIEAKLALKLKPYDDKIVLRWAINNSAAWMMLRTIGVKIDRIILDEKNNPLTPKWETITPTAIKPWDEETFKMRGIPDSMNSALMMVGEALFGQSSFSNVSTDDLQNVQSAGFEFDNRFLLAFLGADMDPKAADALGARFEDIQKVNSKYKYAYKIYPAAILPPIFKIDTAFYITQGYLKDEKHAPRSLMGEGKDRKVYLTLPKDPLYNTYSTYYFERSIDGRDFKQVHKEPVVFNQLDSVSNYLFTDSVENYVTYYYRVRGKDAFGDMSEYSGVVSAMGINTVAPPKGQLYSSLQGKEVQLRWAQDKHENRPLAGFIVRRGKKMEILDEYLTDKLLPPSQLEFKDIPNSLTEGLYYQVLAVDTAGNYSGTNIQFVFAYDSIPPAAPVGLYGIVDTTGIVKLSWKVDRADNIQGYRVFTAHSADADFSPITSDLVRDTVFVDTLDRSVLNKKVFYKFVAVDANNNHSPFSEVLLLERPKLVKTPAPVIKDYLVGKREVSFSWLLPYADDHKSIKILRRISSDTVWSSIADLSTDVKTYKDVSVQEASNYDYAVVVLDNNENWSEISYPLSVFVYANDAAMVEETKMVIKDNKVTLSWKLDKKYNPQHFVLYRDFGEGFEQFESVKGTDRQIVLENEKSKKFGIRVIYADQKKSEIKMF